MRRNTKPDNRIRKTSPHPAPTRFEELLASVGKPVQACRCARSVRHADLASSASRAYTSAGTFAPRVGPPPPVGDGGGLPPRPEGAAAPGNPACGGGWGGRRLGGRGARANA